jgi:carbonic anhydrase
MSTTKAGGWTRRYFVSGLSAAGLAGVSGWSPAQTAATPAVRNGDDAIRELMAGNERFAAGKITSFAEDLEILRKKTVTNQEPFAAILACADSRVPVEIIFDESIGKIFVGRIAGNLVTPEMMASLEYGVAVLGVKAILVLGHSNCGAISAAIAGKEVPGQISALYQHLMPGIRDSHGDVVAAVKANAAYQTRLLKESSTVISKAVKEKGLKVVGGVYDLGTGRVTLVA